MQAILARYSRTPKYTRGLFSIGGETFYTIEPPWKDNQRNISCIPSGEYNVVYLPRSASGKYKRVFHILNVADRGGILIHKGNLVKHTLGCLILGSRPGLLGGQAAVLSSATAMNNLREITGCESFKLTILSEV